MFLFFSVPLHDVSSVYLHLCHTFQNIGPVTLMKEVNPTIRLIDKNDELPYFQGTNRQGRYPGSVPENMEPGQDVITITGYDNDVNPRFSNVSQ